MKICPICGNVKIDEIKNNVFECKNCTHMFSKDLKEKSYYQDKYWREYNKSNGLNRIGRFIATVLFGDKDLFIGLRAKNQYNDIICPHIDPNSKILEIGAGNGKNALFYHNKGFDVTVLEPDKNFCKKLGKKVHCINSTIETARITDKYDLIIMNHVLEHLENPAYVLNGLMKKLNAHGKIFIEVPNCENDASFESSTKDNNHLHHFTKKSLKTLISATSYKMLELKTMSSMIDLTDKSRLEKLFIMSKLKFFPPKDMFREIKDGAYLRALIEKRE